MEPYRAGDVCGTGSHNTPVGNTNWDDCGVGGDRGVGAVLYGSLI